MKKFLAAIVFALFAVTSSASAADVFVCSVDEVDYYVTQKIGTGNLSYTNSIGGYVVGMKHGKEVSSTGYVFTVNHPASNNVYFITIKEGGQKSQLQPLESSALATEILIALLKMP